MQQCHMHTCTPLHSRQCSLIARFAVDAPRGEEIGVLEPAKKEKRKKKRSVRWSKPSNSVSSKTWPGATSSSFPGAGHASLSRERLCAVCHWQNRKFRLTFSLQLLRLDPCIYRLSVFGRTVVSLFFFRWSELLMVFWWERERERLLMDVSWNFLIGLWKLVDVETGHWKSARIQ